MSRLSLLFLSLAVGCGENRSPWTPYEPLSNTELCFSDSDAVLSREEFPFELDLAVPFYEGRDRNIDYAGGVADDGRPIWDFRGNETEDEVIDVTAHSLEDSWYSGDFPTAQWYIEDENKNHSLYAMDASGIVILGLASEDAQPSNGQKNLIVYDRPISILPLPFGVGSTIEDEIQIENATLNDFPLYGSHSYSTRVDDVGYLYLEDVGFTESYRVHSSFSYQIDDAEPVTYRSTHFYVPCVGEVVRLDSYENEDQFNFTDLSSIRRLKWNGLYP